MAVKPPMPRKGKKRTRRTVAYIATAAVIAGLLAFFLLQAQGGSTKPIILYVNQGNGVVNGPNFGEMLTFASSNGFNTVFFQVYRAGVPLFTGIELSSFVNQSHAQGLKIFFALYFTNSSQPLPATVFGLGEDGISLDVSTLSLPTQQSLLADLAACHCKTAVTTTDMTSPLRPDLLILETYGAASHQYVRDGIVASVGVFATSSLSDFQSQFRYAFSNSDGVMVFDYAGLLKSGYQTPFEAATATQS